MTKANCVVVTDIRTLANTPKSPEVSLDDFAYPPCREPEYIELDVLLAQRGMEEAGLPTNLPEIQTRMTALSRSNQTRYRLVLGIARKYLRYNKHRLVTLGAVINIVHKHPEAKKKKLSQEQIDMFLKMLLEDKVVVVDESAPKREPPVTYIKLNPEVEW